MRAPWSLQGFDLLMHFERAGNNNDGNKWEEMLEFRKKIQAQFSLGQHMIQHNDIRGKFLGEF